MIQHSSLLEIKAEFSFETQLLWVETLSSAAPYCITPEQDKSRCHCDNYYTENEPFSFPFFPSRGGAGEINVRVPCSRAPHKSPLWKAGQPHSAPREESGYCSARAQVRHRERLRRNPNACAVGQAAATAGADKGLQVSSPPGSRELCFRFLHHTRITMHFVTYEMEILRSSSPPPLPFCTCGEGISCWTKLGGSISPSTIPSRTEQSFRRPLTSILLLDFKAKLRALFRPNSLGLQIYLTSGSARGDPGPLCHCHGENASSPSTHLPWETKGQGSQREIYGLPLLKDFSRWLSNGGFFFQVKEERRKEGEVGRWVRARPQVTLLTASTSGRKTSKQPGCYSLSSCDGSRCQAQQCAQSQPRLCTLSSY